MRRRQDIAANIPVEQAVANTCAQRVKEQLGELLALLKHLENTDLQRTSKLDIDAASRGHLPEDLAKIHPSNLEEWLVGCSSSLEQLQSEMDNLREAIASQDYRKVGGYVNTLYTRATRATPSLSSSPSASSFSIPSSSPPADPRAASPSPTPRAAAPLRTPRARLAAQDPSNARGYLNTLYTSAAHVTPSPSSSSTVSSFNISSPSPPPTSRAEAPPGTPQARFAAKTSCRQKYRQESCARDQRCVWQPEATTAKRHMIFHAFNWKSHKDNGFWTRGVCRDASPEEAHRKRLALEEEERNRAVAPQRSSMNRFLGKLRPSAPSSEWFENLPAM